nr:hypothetical protein [Tanacetum cinerariifolium]
VVFRISEGSNWSRAMTPCTHELLERKLDENQHSEGEEEEKQHNLVGK